MGVVGAQTNIHRHPNGRACIEAAADRARNTTIVIGADQTTGVLLLDIDVQADVCHDVYELREQLWLILEALKGIDPLAPAPVSSGEAGTGEAHHHTDPLVAATCPDCSVYAADGGYVIRKDNLEDLQAEVSRLAGEALKLKGAQTALAGLGDAVKDLCWKATPMGETADGDVHAYILPKGTVHRLIGVAQGVGIDAAFRAIERPAPVVTPSAEDQP